MAGSKVGPVLSSLRVRLLLLVLFAVVPALGVILYTAWSERHEAVAHASEATRRLARLTAAGVQHAVEDSRRVLSLLAEVPAVRGGDRAACAAWLGGLLPQYAEYANFGVIMPSGDVVCSAVPLSAPVSVADRPHVRRVLETRELVVGEYEIGRITGKAVLPFLYPVQDARGAVQSVVFAALDLGRLTLGGRQAPLPEGSALVVLAHDGRLLTRHPDPAGWTGQVVTGVPIVRTILARRDGITTGPGLDGVPRLRLGTAFHASPVAMSLSALADRRFIRSEPPAWRPSAANVKPRRSRKRGV